jgi:hypothetical protein
MRDLLVRFSQSTPKAALSRSLVASATGLALVIAGASLLWSGAPRAEVVDPTIAKTVAIGSGAGPAPAERGNAQHNGRIASLPREPRVRWTARVPASRLEYSPISPAAGTIFAAGTNGGATVVVEVGPTGALAFNRIEIAGETPATGPIALASGVRVLLTQKGSLYGFDASGAQRFKTELKAELASIMRASMVPLPTGGFGVARSGDLIELDGSGNELGRTRLSFTGAIAARANGELAGVTPAGELFTWRAGRVPKQIGTFGASATSGGYGSGGSGGCNGGPVLDGEETPRAGGRRERAICATDTGVEQIDLGTGLRSAILGRGALSYRTSAAVGARGDLAVVSAGGALFGTSAAGGEYGPLDVPGAAAVVSFGRDAGFLYGAIGEVPPLVADDGAVLFGASEGLAIARPGEPPSRFFPRCSGLAATVVGVVPMGPGQIAIACSDGQIEAFADPTRP